jgi:hypothetical protein
MNTKLVRLMEKRTLYLKPATKLRWKPGANRISTCSSTKEGGVLQVDTFPLGGTPHPEWTGLTHTSQGPTCGNAHNPRSSTQHRPNNAWFWMQWGWTTCSCKGSDQASSPPPGALCALHPATPCCHHCHQPVTHTGRFLAAQRGAPQPDQAPAGCEEYAVPAVMEGNLV